MITRSGGDGGWKTRAAVYGPIGLLAALLFAPRVHDSLVADDWMVLGRYLDFSVSQVPSWFFSVRNDWYRPVFEILAALGWRAFGVDPFGYHLVALALYAATVVGVGLTAERLAGDRLVGAVAAVVFAVLQFHTETVLWFSASSELLAALLILAALGAYVRYRSGGGARWLGVATATYLMAVGTKETALVAPALFVAHDLLPGREALRGPSRPAIVAPWLLFAALSVPFAAMRVSAGSPYAVAVTPGGLARNTGFYALLELAAAPIDIDITSPAPLGQERRGATLAMLAATAGLALLGAGWLRARGWRTESCRPRSLGFAAVAGLVLLVPVLPIVSERTAFGSSIGLAWAIALVAGCNWRSSSGVPAARALVVTAVALILAANAAVLAYRSAWWGRSSAAVATTLASIHTAAADLPPDATMWIVGLPDHFHDAWAFRNAFHPDRPGADEVLQLGHPVFSVLDTELAGLEPEPLQRRIADLQQQPGVAVFLYQNEAVRQLR